MAEHSRGCSGDGTTPTRWEAAPAWGGVSGGGGGARSWGVRLLVGQGQRDGAMELLARLPGRGRGVQGLRRGEWGSWRWEVGW